MQSRKRILLSTTMVPLVVFAGVAIGGAVLSKGFSVKPALAHSTATKINPCAAAKPNTRVAAACNPCAASKCNPCNPCAAAKCNPCAAAKCNPCNPCAAAKCNPCNPCAAAKCNPCNPCAAGGGGISKKCVMKTAAGCNPCNPCAAKKCNPCNPCAAAKCNPCNPCAASACNPCGAGGAVELSDADAVKIYDCLLDELKAAYAKSGNAVAVSYSSWPRYSKQAYVSATHGERYVQNYANGTARAYGAYEKAGAMPVGSALAKDSFSVKPNGKVALGPLFIMEKMNAGFNAESGDWRYTMVMPNGSVFGATNGAGSNKVEFCIGCHISVAPDVDSMMFLPEEYRVTR